MGRPQAQRPVDATESTVSVQKLPVGHQHSEVRLGIEVVSDPPEHDLRRLAERRIVSIVRLARGLIIGKNERQSRSTELPGELRTVLGLDDRPRLDERDRTRDSEKLLPLEKERPQFRVVDRKPLVDLDLRAIGLDLRKIWVVGEVERRIRRDAVLDIGTPSVLLSLTNCPVVSRKPARPAVTVGMISRLRLSDRPDIPSSTPIWDRKPETSRESGAQTSLSSLLSMVRTTWNPQRCPWSSFCCG